MYKFVLLNILGLMFLVPLIYVGFILEDGEGTIASVIITTCGDGLYGSFSLEDDEGDGLCACFSLEEGEGDRLCMCFSLEDGERDGIYVTSSLDDEDGDGLYDVSSIEEEDGDGLYVCFSLEDGEIDGIYVTSLIEDGEGDGLYNTSSLEDEDGEGSTISILDSMVSFTVMLVIEIFGNVKYWVIFGWFRILLVTVTFFVLFKVLFWREGTVKFVILNSITVGITVSTHIFIVIVCDFLFIVHIVSQVSIISVKTRVILKRFYNYFN